MTAVYFTYELKDDSFLLAEIECYADCDWDFRAECLYVAGIGFTDYERNSRGICQRNTDGKLVVEHIPASPEWRDKLLGFFTANCIERAEDVVRDDYASDGISIPDYDKPETPRFI